MDPFQPDKMEFRHPGSVRLSELVLFLDSLLQTDQFPDESLNGMQVESTQEVTRIGAAVDAGESVIAEAVEKGVDLLLVHHGLLWGRQQRLSGPLGRKIGALYRNRISLYCAHLPLDAHMEHGNNAILARMVDLSSIRPALKYRGREVGVVGSNSSQLTASEMAGRLKSLGGYGPGQQEVLLLPFGPRVPEKVAVLTGAGCIALDDAAAEGFDTLITGEPRQSAYHRCKEDGLNLICAGHYATETVGVRSIAQIVAEKFKIGQIFLDCPTGI